MPNVIEVLQIELAKLDLKEGDVLLLQYDITKISPKNTENLLNQLEALKTTPGYEHIKLLLLPNDFEVSILSKEHREKIKIALGES